MTMTNYRRLPKSALAVFVLSFLALLATTTPGANALQSMELKYFDARGAAEVIRLLFAIADVPYTDTRYTITPGSMEAPEFKAAKESGDLDMNLGRAPLLVVDGTTTIGQSKAIERYLAAKFGMMGDSPEEAAQIDCIAEHCVDVKMAQQRKGFSMFARDKTDDEKAKLKEEWFGTDLPTFLAKIEKAVALTSQSKGYAMGSKTSYADISIFALLRGMSHRCVSQLFRTFCCRREMSFLISILILIFVRSSWVYLLHFLQSYPSSNEHRLHHASRTRTDLEGGRKM